MERFWGTASLNLILIFRQFREMPIEYLVGFFDTVSSTQKKLYQPSSEATVRMCSMK